MSRTLLEKPLLKLVLLFGLIIFDGYRVLIGTSFSLKPFLVIAVLLILWTSFRRLYVPLNFRLFILWFLSLFIPLIFGTVLSTSQFVVIIFGQALLTLFLLAFHNFLILRQVKLEDIFDAIIFLGVFTAAIGFLQVVLFFLGLNVGVSHFEDVGVPRPESFFSETDWHAMFVGYCLLASLFINEKSRFNIIKKQINLFLLLSLITSFGRTAIAGALASYLVHLMLFYPLPKLMARAVKFLVIAVPIFILLLPVLPESIVSRFDIVGNIEDPELDAGAINSRVFAIQMTIAFIEENPLTGNGAGSLNYLANNDDIKAEFSYGGGINSGRGGTNIFLTSLFDSGILGLLVMVILLTGILISGYRYAKKKSNDYQYFFQFCLLSNIYFLVECQANNMIRTPIVWVNFALFTYAVYLFHTDKKISQGAV